MRERERERKRERERERERERVMIKTKGRVMYPRLNTIARSRFLFLSL